MKINKGKANRSRRVLIYGENGVGKSTIASQFPKPLCLNLEDGVGDIECDSTDRIKTFNDFYGALVECASTEYRTIWIDTVDWAEKLLMTEVATKAGKEVVEDIGFGKGYQKVEFHWEKIIDALTVLWKQNRHIVMTCHERITKLPNPDGETISLWAPDLSEKCSGLIMEWCDEVLYCKYKTFNRKLEEGPKQGRTIQAAISDRVIVCNKQPGIEAKNRLGMPDEVPLSIESFKQYIPRVELKLDSVMNNTPFSLQEKGNVEGIVVDGSSKPKVFEPMDSPF